MWMDSCCPVCGAHDLRIARSQGFREHLLALLGVYPLRCRNCQNRFRGQLWKISQVRYAHCPKCYRTQLSTWSEQYYNPTTGVKFKLALGATPYRCEFCRCNFASFRACKERFSWRKYQRDARLRAAAAAAGGAGPPSKTQENLSAQA